MAETRKRIVSQVWDFVKGIQNGSIDGEVVEEHKIPTTAINILQNSAHPSHRVVSNMVFRHLMENIGYYDMLPSGQNIGMLSEKVVLQRLYNPGPTKIRKMLMPKDFINGVEECIQLIEELGKSDKCKLNGSVLSGSYRLYKVPRSYAIEVQTYVDYTISNHFVCELISGNVEIGGRTYSILQDGCNVRRVTRNWPEPDVITLGFDNFCSDSLNLDTSYFYRYVTLIDSGDSPFSLMERYRYMIGESDAEGVEVYSNQSEGARIFVYQSGGVPYLVIDSLIQLTASQMNQKIFPLLVALGIITTSVYLDECWMFAFNDTDHLNYVGLYYRSLAPTSHCKYPIITSNVFQYLVPVAKKIDEKNGEKRAIEIIQNYHLSEALPLFPLDVFSRLVGILTKYDSVCRGVFIVLSGTDYTLEIQPGVFAVGLEAISNIKKDILGNDSKYIIEPERFDELQLKSTVTDLLKQSKDDGALNQTEYDSMCKRVEQLNEAFNSDKLRSLLKYYNYPLTIDDDVTIKLRNTLLHGSINIKDKKFSIYGESGALFKTALIFHKLCLSIPLMMAGYHGYIINNAKAFGFDKTCKSFIKL